MITPPPPAPVPPAKRVKRERKRPKHPFRMRSSKRSKPTITSKISEAPARLASYSFPEREAGRSAIWALMHYCCRFGTVQELARMPLSRLGITAKGARQFLERTCPEVFADYKEVTGRSFSDALIVGLIQRIFDGHDRMLRELTDQLKARLAKEKES